MNVFLPLLLCLSLLGLGLTASADAPARPGWTLSFDDEFKGHTLNARHWTASRGAVTESREHALQYFQPTEVTVQHGSLHLRAERRTYGEYDFTSGEIRTLNKFAQKYGRFEVRCRFPRTRGSWAAFYLLPATDDWPPEIDVTEFIGRTPSIVYLTNHWGTQDAHQQNYDRRDDPAADWGRWHTYAIEWEPGALRWYIDGVRAATTTAGVPDVPMYLRLNSSVGGHFAGDPDPTGWPQDFEVDYVRVYRRPGLPQPVFGHTAIKRPSPPPDALSAPSASSAPDTGETGSGTDDTGAGLGLWALLAAVPLWLLLEVAGRRNETCRSLLRKVLAVAVSVSALDYGCWRMSVINWEDSWVALPLFAAEAFGIFQVLGFHYTVWPRPQPRLEFTEDPARRPIYLFIPTVNEGAEIVERTTRGALAARERFLGQHPEGRVTIVICNDGCAAQAPGWQEIERLAERLGVLCLTRPVGGGAKAGNVEFARERTGATGEALVGVFDADMTPEAGFLVQTVPPFADPGVGWVQTGQYYRNLENPVARWADDQQALFFRVLCPGKAALNANFLCGTNFLVRAAALDEIGGLPQDSLTEDFAASVLLHARWRSVYLPDVLATGLGPVDLPSYFSQQQRWAMGTFGVLRRHWRLIFLPQPGGLSLPQRIQYALSGTHYLCGLCQLIFLLTPLLYLLTHASPFAPVSLPLFLVHFGPYWLLSQLAFWSAAGRRAHLRGTTLGYGSTPVLLRSLSALFSQKPRRFVVTAKKRQATSSWRSLLPQGIALGACLLGLAGALAGAARSPLLLLSAYWLCYTLALLCAVLWLGYSDWRIDRKAPHE